MSRRGRQLRRKGGGFTLVEVLVALAIGAVLVTGLAGVTEVAFSTWAVTAEKERLTREARFAMDQMVRIASRSPGLLLPLPDNPATNWPENVREQTEPASPPIGDSSLATGVLALRVPLDQDLDSDGYPDADDDRDGLVDEDLPNDIANDGVPGLYEIDDDGDGGVDENGFFVWNDDEVESGFDEDRINGVDDDGDGSVDEDPPGDMNADFCAGLCGVDDDGDGSVDETGWNDDDEDGATDEDWINPVVFHFDQGALYQRTPVPWDESGGGGVTGRDFVTHRVADNVTRFRVERVSAGGVAQPLLDLTLELTGPASGETVRLQTQVRVGGAL